MTLYRRTDFVLDQEGRGVSGALVTVIDPNTGAPASIFSDDAGLVPLANPFLSDPVGKFSYVAQQGIYRETVSRPGYYDDTTEGVAVGVLTGPQGERGLQGPQGERGPSGAPGADLSAANNWAAMQNFQYGLLAPVILDLNQIQGENLDIFGVQSVEIGPGGAALYDNGAGQLGINAPGGVLLDDTDLDVHGVIAQDGVPILPAFADTADPLKNAGMVGFNAALAYAANTAGDALKTCLAFITNLAASSGSSLVGFIQSGTGAAARTVQDKVRETVSVHDYMTLAQIADAESGAMAIDLRNAVQAAIDAAIILQKKLIWPKGNYRIDTPLHIWDWTGTAFRYFCFEAEGEKAPWTDYTVNRRGTFITATFNDRPAIMVQQARSFVFRNITVSGQNNIVSLMGVLPTFAGLFTNSNYVTNGCRDTRYSPYAGICIDPFGTSVPADGGYPGYSAYYLGGNAGSMYTLLDSAIVQKFVVAIAFSPNGNTQNDEDITLIRCKTMYNKVSVSIGQSQSRNVNVYGHTAWFHLVVFDGLSYGQRQGFLPNIFGANISLAKYFTASTSSFNTTLGVYNVYSEQLGSIGFLSANSPASINNGIAFSGCTFKFDSADGTTPDHHLIAWCPVVFSGCTITTADKNFPLRIRHDTPTTSITFTGCNFRFGTSEATFGFHGSSRAGEIDDLIFHNNILSMQSPSSTHNFSHEIYRFSQSSMNKKFVPMGSRLAFGDSIDKIYTVGALSTGHDLSLGTVALTVAGSGNGSFTVADGAIVRVGDVIRCATSVNYEGAVILDASTIAGAYNAIGVVTAVVGNNVSITGIPQGIASGSYAIYKSWTPRFHSATTGDTNSNTSLTNVANAAAWSIGDPIRGTGIPAGAYITNIVGTTITISKAATATAVGVRLYDASIYVFSGTAV